jgi:hypothetical protein
MQEARVAGARSLWLQVLTAVTASSGHVLRLLLGTKGEADYRSRIQAIAAGGRPFLQHSIIMLSNAHL